MSRGQPKPRTRTTTLNTVDDLCVTFGAKCTLPAKYKPVTQVTIRNYWRSAPSRRSQTVEGEYIFNVVRSILSCSGLSPLVWADDNNGKIRIYARNANEDTIAQLSMQDSWTFGRLDDTMSEVIKRVRAGTGFSTTTFVDEDEVELLESLKTTSLGK